jgi:hypothetical protein
VWRRAFRAAAGAMMVVAIVVLVMIAQLAHEPPVLILVPPPGEVGPYVPPTSVVDIVATQSAESTFDPASTSSPDQAVPSPKPVTRQTTTTTAANSSSSSSSSAAGAPAPPPATSAAQPPPVASQGPVIVCPDVASALPAVPAGAQTDVTRELRYLDTILADANRRLRAAQSIPDPNFVQNAILGPLINQRIASLDRITIAIDRFAPRPSGLERLARCAVR